MNRLVTTVILASLSLPVLALPQTVTGVAYPQEIYYLRDLRFYSAQTLFDLLRHIPGVSVGFQPDGQAEIQLHGLDSRYLTILVNGQPLLGGGTNNVRATREIPASLVERIEIDRNARADIHLGGAPAGTINVILQTADGAEFVGAGLGGQNLSSRLAFATRLIEGNHSLRLSGEQRLNRNEMEGDVRSAAIDDRWHGYDRSLNRDLLLSYNHKLNQRHDLQLYALQLKSSEEQRYHGVYPLNRISTLTVPDLGAADTERQADKLTQRFGINLRLRWKSFALRSWVTAEQYDQDIEMEQSLPDQVEQTQQIDDSRYAIGWQLQELQDEHRWSAGLNFEQKKRVHGSLTDTVLISSNEPSGLPYNYDIKQNLMSAFLLDRWRLTRNTEFEAGIHLYSYEVSLDSQSDTGSSGIATDTHWLPTFHLMHRFAPGKRLRLSMSQNTREPELTDRVPYRFQQQNIVWQGNDDLNPELISNINLGYEQNFHERNSPLADRNSGFVLRAFQRIINNAIYQRMTAAADNSGQIELTPANYPGNAVLRGGELDVEFYPGSRDMRVDIGGGIYSSQIQATTELDTSPQLPNQPQYMARLGFHHHPIPQLRYGGHWLLQGPSKQLLPVGEQYTERKTTRLQRLDLYAEYQWNQRWHSLISINLTPGMVPWQQQGDIRQYRDIEPVWQINLIGTY